jgi:beta-glucosidase
MGKRVEARVVIQNISEIPGDEVVQLYISDLESSFRVPNSKLIGIKKINLKPGEAKNIKFLITSNMMSNVNRNGKLSLEPGRYKITIGPSSPWSKSESYGLSFSSSYFTIY